MSDLTVTVEGEDVLQRELSLLAGTDLRKLNQEIGYNVQERTADWIAEASVTRHRTADELGAKHTGFLEFAPGRIRSVCKFKGRDGNPPTIRSDNVTDTGVDIVFENTPGLRRAFGPLTITPVRAKALTIPKHAVSYARTVSELRAEGHRIFRPGKARILVENVEGAAPRRGKGKNAAAKPNWRVLYILAKKATIRHDPELLPDEQHYADWAADTIDAFLALHGAE